MFPVAVVARAAGEATAHPNSLVGVSPVWLSPRAVQLSSASVSRFQALSVLPPIHLPGQSLPLQCQLPFLTQVLPHLERGSSLLRVPTVAPFIGPVFLVWPSVILPKVPVWPAPSLPNPFTGCCHHRVYSSHSSLSTQGSLQLLSPFSYAFHSCVSLFKKSVSGTW